MTLQMTFRDPNAPNFKIPKYIIPHHEDMIKHPSMKKHSCKPILNQIMIYIHFSSTRLLLHLGVDFISYLSVLHHLGVDFANKI